eukprot:RCo038709
MREQLPDVTAPEEGVPVPLQLGLVTNVGLVLQLLFVGDGLPLQLALVKAGLQLELANVGLRGPQAVDQQALVHGQVDRQGHWVDGRQGGVRGGGQRAKIPVPLRLDHLTVVVAGVLRLQIEVIAVVQQGLAECHRSVRGGASLDLVRHGLVEVHLGAGVAVLRGRGVLGALQHLHSPVARLGVLRNHHLAGLGGHDHVVLSEPLRARLRNRGGLGGVRPHHLGLLGDDHVGLEPQHHLAFLHVLHLNVHILAVDLGLDDLALQELDGPRGNRPVGEHRDAALGDGQHLELRGGPVLGVHAEVLLRLLLQRGKGRLHFLLQNLGVVLQPAYRDLGVPVQLVHQRDLELNVGSYVRNEGFGVVNVLLVPGNVGLDCRLGVMIGVGELRLGEPGQGAHFGAEQSGVRDVLLRRRTKRAEEDSRRNARDAPREQGLHRFLARPPHFFAKKRSKQPPKRYEKMIT